MTAGSGQAVGPVEMWRLFSNNKNKKQNAIDTRVMPKRTKITRHRYERKSRGTDTRDSKRADDQEDLAAYKSVRIR